jgi:hypothetical protein
MAHKKRKKKLKDVPTGELERLRADHRALVARMDKPGLAPDNLYRLFANNLGEAIDTELDRREQDTQKENEPYGR